MAGAPNANTLFYGDNLDILRRHIADESIDLVYLDPPFNSNATYNVLFKSPAGEQSAAQIEAFDDTWHWNISAERAFDEIIESGHTDAANMIMAMRSFLGENDMMAYLTMMAVRLIELHRVLKPTGSLYLHCDPTASHYLRIILDAIFGSGQFLNELIWKRSSAHTAKRYAPVHDTILFYAKGPTHTWNQAYQPIPQETADAWYNNVEAVTGRRYNRADLTAAGVRTGPSGQAWRGIDVTAKGRHWAIPGFVKLTATNTLDALEELDAMGRLHWPKAANGTPMLKRYLEESPGIPALDLIADIAPLNNVAKERLGYPTQKPLALLERLICASSNEGDVILDPFCGCGTTIHAAQKLKRSWLGIDITHLAVGLIQKRLNEAFPSVKYDIVGVPKDIGAAIALAMADKHEFQKWALSLVEAQPYKGGKKGADGGVDGYIYFKPEGKKTEKAIVSVKGGQHVSDTMIKDLITTVDHEGAKMGIFITLSSPTKPMIKRAASAGFYKPDSDFSKLSGENYPKIQIFTIAELFDGKRPRMPWVDTSGLKKAKVEKEAATQGALDL